MSSIYRLVLKNFFLTKNAWILTIFSLFGFLITLVSPYLNGLFIDFLVNNNDYSKVINLALLIATAGIIGALLNYFIKILSVKTIQQSSFKTLSDTILGFEHSSLEKIEAMDPMYATQRIITDSNTITTFVIGNYLSIWLNAILIIAIIVLFYIIQFQICILSLLLIGIYAIFLLKIKKPLYNVSYKKKEADSTYFSAVSSQIKNILDIKIRSAYHASMTYLKTSFRQYLPVVIKFNKVQGILLSSDQSIGAVFQSFLLIISGINILSGKMTLGDYVMVSTYFSYLLKCTNYYTGYYQNYQDALASFSRINQILSFKDKNTGLVRISQVKSITVNPFEHTYQVNNCNNHLFFDEELNFSEGNTYSITGENGSGKSTIFKILLGLYNTNSSVLYNNMSMSGIDKDQLRRDIVSAVPQKLFALDMSVRDFISYYCGYASSPETILDSTPLQHCAIDLKSKLDLSCQSLSGGELQRLYLCLATARKTSMLILDEPSNNLDQIGTSELANYVLANPKNQLIILITHDAKLIEITDSEYKLGR